MTKKGLEKLKKDFPLGSIVQDIWIDAYWEKYVVVGYKQKRGYVPILNVIRLENLTSSKKVDDIAISRCELIKKPPKNAKFLIGDKVLCAACIGHTAIIVDYGKNNTYKIKFDPIEMSLSEYSLIKI